MERTVQSYRVGPAETVVRQLDRSEALAAVEGRSLFVFDENTRPLFDAGERACVVLPSGESHKRWSAVEQILSAAVAGGLARDATFVGCGGGVVCDVVAFAASIYMRGCAVILVPTTLLAMVDAAFGGKTGVDFAGYKNMLGSFHPAREIRIAVQLLESLPEREYTSGLAEVIKAALLGERELHTLLANRAGDIKRRDPELLRALIMASLSVKGRLVEEDFQERGVRAHLNLGHTFGHALESATGFGTWSHGAAVAWGIDKAVRLGRLLGVTDAAYELEVRELLRSYGFELRTRREFVEPIIAAMQHDKKMRDGRVRFVLQRRFGDTFVSEVAADAVREALFESCG